MESIAGAIAGTWVLVFLMVLIWLFLPLAILGTKPILRQQLDELKAIHKVLNGMERLP